VFALVWNFLTSRTGFNLLYSQLGPGVWTVWGEHASSFPVFVPLIIVLGLGYGWLSRLLTTKLALLLGEISYSVYLLHAIVFRFYTKHWPQPEPDYWGLVICVSLILVLSYVLWRAVELPCRQVVKKRLAQRPSPPPMITDKNANLVTSH
jgi:peptidoglycan/LPS O-acetylase OafA/YrhL